MAKKVSLNPTLAGACSVVIWGSALPIVKLVEERIGLLAFMGFAYSVIAAFGLISYWLRRRPLPAGLFRKRPFYARWLFFVLHEGLLTAAIFLVQKNNMPLVILINYLWPTAIILCSVLLAVVKVTRWWAFLLGSSAVLLSLVAELVGPGGFTRELFSRRADCWAYLLVFIGAISWGMYSALSRRYGDATGAAMVLPLFQATLGLALPISLLPGRSTWARLGPGPLLLLVGYCFLLYLSYAAWDFGMRRGNVVLLSLFADLIPWLSLASANLLLHVSIGSRALTSAVVLIAGAMLARYGTLQKRPILAAYTEPGI